MNMNCEIKKENLRDVIGEVCSYINQLDDTVNLLVKYDCDSKTCEIRGDSTNFLFAGVGSGLDKHGIFQRLQVEATFCTDFSDYSTPHNVISALNTYSKSGKLIYRLDGVCYGQSYQYGKPYVPIVQVDLSTQIELYDGNSDIAHFLLSFIIDEDLINVTEEQHSWSSKMQPFQDDNDE